VRVTGAGTIDLAEKTLALRTEPKLVLTTQGQGRTSDPVGLGIPVVIDGPWAEPRIYPDMAGILDNPDAAYARLKEMGKGLFGSNGALGGLGGNLLGGSAPSGNTPGTNAPSGSAPDANAPGGDPLGGSLGEALGNLIQQGLSQSRQGNPSQGTAQGRSRALSTPDAATPPAQTPPAPGDSTPPPAQESQPMNDVLRQLFNR
jgi:AsmA protein